MQEAAPDNFSSIETPWERRASVSSELGRLLRELHDISQRPLGPQTPFGPADREATKRRIALETRFNELVSVIPTINQHVPRHPHWIPNGNHTPWREVAREPVPLDILPPMPPLSPVETSVNAAPEQSDDLAAASPTGA